MYNVGILANESVWEENLSAFSKGAPFHVVGSTQDFSNHSTLEETCFAKADAIWIPQKTKRSMEAAIQSLRSSRHVLLGFPVVDFQSEANLLVELAREANVDVQVGHHDRYHPAFRAVQEQLNGPQFIDIQHDLSPAISCAPNFYLTPILHNVDAILALVKAGIKKVHAHQSILNQSDQRNIHIRLEFHNGTVANIQIRNLGFPEKRRMEVMDIQHLFHLDLIRGESQSLSLANRKQTKTQIWPIGSLLGVESGRVDEESLTRECVSYFLRKANNRKPLASIEEGYEALQITKIILKKIGEAPLSP